MSESMNLGQINISTEIRINGNVKDIKTGLTLISNRHFTKKILHKAINNTETEKKNKCGLMLTVSIEKK